MSRRWLTAEQRGPSLLLHCARCQGGAIYTPPIAAQDLRAACERFERAHGECEAPVRMTAERGAGKAGR